MLKRLIFAAATSVVLAISTCVRCGEVLYQRPTGADGMR